MLKLYESKRIYRDLVPVLEQDELKNPNEINLIQREGVKRVLLHASEHCEYYKKLFYTLNIDLESSDIIAELSKVPVTTKQSMLDHFDSIKADNFENYNSMLHSSGGTTGTTLNFYLDELSYLAREAEVLLYWKRHGYIVGKEKTVMLRAGVIIPDGKKITKPWRHDYARKMLYLSSYYSSPEFFQEYYQLLIKWKPKFIHALPSAAYLFASYLVNNQLTIPVAKVFTASEMLYPHQRDVLEKAFDCKVVEHYGHSEPGNYAAGQCSYSNYHIAPRNVYMEVTDKGELIETSLNNYSMPFIRYKIGDNIDKVFYSPCNCGLATPYFTKISGRESELIHTGDGRTISSIGFDQIFRNNEVALGQIIQSVRGEIILKIVTKPSFTEKNRNNVIKALVERVGSSTKIDLILTDEIPLEKNGKYRMIKSEI